MTQNRQHVGAITSVIEGGEMPLDEFRAKAAALAAIAKPLPSRTAVRDYGDGDPCPANRGHGHMYVDGQRQYCPHHDHDNDNSRCFWPLYPVEIPDMPTLED